MLQPLSNVLSASPQPSGGSITAIDAVLMRCALAKGPKERFARRSGRRSRRSVRGCRSDGQELLAASPAPGLGHPTDRHLRRGGEVAAASVGCWS
jgi:hypothetical protein